jgi:hypothetical protein
MMRSSVGGAIAAVLHLGVLGVTIAWIFAAGDADWRGYWMLFLALDFPVSLGVFPVSWLVPAAPAGPLADLSNFWWPLAYHGVVGTWWWYVVGWAIERKLGERRGGRRDEQTRKD